MLNLDVTYRKEKKKLPRLHTALTAFMARNEIVMFLGGLLFNAVIVFCIAIYGAGVIYCNGSIQIDALRPFMLVYGIINTLFYVYAIAMICEPEYEPYSYDERIERYGKYLSPIIVLFPLLAPHAIAIGLSLLAYIIFKGVNKVYHKLESKVL